MKLIDIGWAGRHLGFALPEGYKGAVHLRSLALHSAAGWTEIAGAVKLYGRVTPGMTENDVLPILTVGEEGGFFVRSESMKKEAAGSAEGLWRISISAGGDADLCFSYGNRATPLQPAEPPPAPKAKKPAKE